MEGERERDRETTRVVRMVERVLMLHRQLASCYLMILLRCSLSFKSMNQRKRLQLDLLVEPPIDKGYRNPETMPMDLEN